MLFIGDIHIYVSDFTLALRFWADGLALEVAEQEISRHSAYARLNFPDGGPSIRLLGPVETWAPDARPPDDTHPSIRFDVTTADFDTTLARLIEYGGRQVDQIETYNDLRAVTIADPDGNTFELLEIHED
ncbi:MAG: VOC family protein [Phycisphaerae bacterium]|nr:VOC family protein [Phycisphaerae bacterium]